MLGQGLFQIGIIMVSSKLNLDWPVADLNFVDLVNSPFAILEKSLIRALTWKLAIPIFWPFVVPESEK